MDAQVDADRLDAKSNSPAASLPGLPGGIETERDEAVKGETASGTSTPNGLTSSPPVLLHSNAMDVDPPIINGVGEDASGKRDSDEETIVLHHSPTRVSKSIKHEDLSEDEKEDEEMQDVSRNGDVPEDEDEDAKKVGGEGGGGKTTTTTTTARSDLLATTLNSASRKRKRNSNSNIDDDKDDTRDRDRPARPKTNGNGNGTSNANINGHGNGTSSGLSSVPLSPTASARQTHPKTSTNTTKTKRPTSESSRSPSPRSTSTHSTRNSGRQKVYATDSGDEAEGRRFNRQRSSGVEHKQHTRDKSAPAMKNAESISRKRTNSTSPQPARGHRRSISTQLPAKSSHTHGLSHKKKRIPAPLQSTDYASDDSSESGSSHPRSSRLRHLAAPTTGDSAISPAKMPPPKKHTNTSGQTWLLRACHSGKLDLVKQRLDDRPEDLNVGDHALNTPLHTASIAGHADIVKFLLDAGCTVDPVNMNKDTPLHDAIDNGYLDVVKLLLNAGANPRKPNKKGEEPFDLVDDDDDVAEALREAITAAKEKTSHTRHPSSDNQMLDTTNGRQSQSRESPRNTPPIQSSESMAQGRRAASTRTTKTSDRALYQRLDLNELRSAAGSGDVLSVARILEVMGGTTSDPKSLINAAKAGHAEVVDVMLAMGDFDPDPEPIDTEPPQSATPILAAIGKENIEVLKILLAQAHFDPTRRVDGDTYYEIAKRRAGSVWDKEHVLLKNAFDEYKKTHKSPKKSRLSNSRREGRESDHNAKQSARKEGREEPRSHTRTENSPKRTSLESDKSTGSRPKVAKDEKRGLGRPKKEERPKSAGSSDHEAAPLGPPKQKSQARRPESETALSSDNETSSKPPRRRLMTGKERDLIQRRSSVASTASSASLKDKRDGNANPDKLARKTSPSVPRITKTTSEGNDLKQEKSEKHTPDVDKARSLKRDDSKDRLSAIRGETPVKRPRSSETPPRSSMQEVTSARDGNGQPQKKRRTEEPKAKSDNVPSSSPENRSAKAHDKPRSATSESKSKDRDKTTDKTAPPTSKRVKSPERARKPLPKDEKPPTDDKSVPKDDKSSVSTSSSSETKKSVKAHSEKTAKDPVAPQTKADEERESKKRLEKEEYAAQVRRQKEELEAKENAALEKKLEAERIAQAKEAQIARDQAAREEELKRQREETELKEKRRQEDAEAHAREQEKQKQMFLEQEKHKKEESARKRAQAQEQLRVERQRIEREKEAERLAKLPLLLRWLDTLDDPKTPDVATMFKTFDGYRYDTIQPQASGQADVKEQWMLNTNVALLLGEKDLHLSRCKNLSYPYYA